VLPLTGSGTRDTWETGLGLAAFGSCVVNGLAANGNVIEEDNGLSAGNTGQFTSSGVRCDRAARHLRSERLGLHQRDHPPRRPLFATNATNEQWFSR
jgi:hypothetical protein